MSENPKNPPKPTDLSVALAAILATEPSKPEQQMNEDPAKPAPAAPVETKEPAPKEPEANPAPASGGADLVAYLKGELSALKEELKAASTQVASLQAEVTKLRAMEPEEMTAVVRETAKALSIKLNNSYIGLDDLSGKSLLSLVEKLGADFNAKFKPGQRSVTAPADSTPPAAPFVRTTATKLPR